jgi:hypothetical protein
MDNKEQKIHDDIQASEEMEALHERIHNLDEMCNLKEYISYVLYKNNLSKDFDVNVTISVKLHPLEE